MDLTRLFDGDLTPEELDYVNDLIRHADTAAAEHSPFQSTLTGGQKMVKVGIYEADRHSYVYDHTDVKKVEEEARDRQKPNNYYSRQAQYTVIHYHKKDVAACAGYRHEEFPALTNANAD